MVDEQGQRVRLYTWLFIGVGVVMIVAGLIDLLTVSGSALLDWVVIACGVFNIGIAVIFHQRRR